MAPIPGIGEHTQKILSEQLDRVGPKPAHMENLGRLEEIRESINALDQEIVQLLAEREGYVRQAAHFKKTPEDMETPKRAEEVIQRVRKLANGYGGSPDVAEEVYRTMISRFVSLMNEHADDTC